MDLQDTEIAASPIDGGDDGAGYAHPGNEAISFRTRGAYSINGRNSFPCLTELLSVSGLTINVLVKPQVGDSVDAIFDTIGRLQGKASALTRSGFILALEENIPAALRQQIAFLSNAALSADQRRHFRLTPRRQETTIRKSDRTSHPARIVDFSISGASIETDAPLCIGEAIEFARSTRAVIVRVIDGNRYGVEFDRHFRPPEFNWTIRL